LSTPLVNSIVFGLRPIRFGQKPEESGMNACKEMKTFRRDRRYLADGCEHELACQCSDVFLSVSLPQSGRMSPRSTPSAE
jgi:hypothetical protein